MSKFNNLLDSGANALVAFLIFGALLSLVAVVTGGIAEEKRERDFMVKCLTDKNKTVWRCEFDYWEYTRNARYGR